MAANDHTPPALPVKIPIIATDFRRSAGNTDLASGERWTQGRAISTSPSVDYAAYRVYFGRNSEFLATLMAFNSIFNTNIYVRI
jgi:hypothetical protein